LVNVRWGIVVAGAMALLAVLPALFIRTRSTTGPAEETKRVAGRSALSIPLVGALVVSCALFAVSNGLFRPFLNIFFKEHYGASLEAIGLVMALGAGVATVGLLVAPYAVRRLGERRSLLLVALASAPILPVIGYAPTFWASGFAYICRNMIVNITFPVFTAVSMAAVPPDVRATLSALQVTAWTAGLGLGSLISGGMQARMGLAPLFWVALVLQVAFGVWVFFGERRARPA